MATVTARSLTPTEQDLARRYPDWNPSDGESPVPGTLHRLQAGTEDDPRLRAWKDAATAFVASLNPRDFGRAGALHAVWEPLAPDGALCFDVCDGTGTTGGAVGLDWQTAWGESDESTIRDWLGEAERRPWDMGPACDGCRGAVG